MNIFELSEEKIKKVLETELNKVTSEELLEELIECGLEIKEEIPLNIEAEYQVNIVQGDYDCESIWRSVKTTGWTNLKYKLIGKNEDNNSDLPLSA